MTAGKLNQRVYLQHRDPTLNAQKEQSKNWLMLTPNGIWAQVAPLRGREFFAAAQQQDEITTRFRIRHRKGITAKMRLLWRDVPYDIVTVIEVEAANEWIDLMCKTGTRDGRIA